MRFIGNYWKTILITMIILILSLANLSSLDEVPKFTYGDKIVHFLMYFGLTLTAIRDYSKENCEHKSRWRFFFLCLAFPLCLGLITEILQVAFVPGRSGEWNDCIANAMGILSGWGVSALIGKTI